MGKNIEKVAADVPKRGRPPKSAAGNLSKNMYLRVRPELFDALGRSAEAANRSISEECEFRLNRSVQREAAFAEVFGSTDQQELLLAIGNAVRYANGLSNGTQHDNVVQGYAAAIAIVQGLSGKPAADVLKSASETGHGWRDAAAGVLALERHIDEADAALLVDPRAPQLTPRTRAVLKEEAAEKAEQQAEAPLADAGERMSGKPRRRSLGDIMRR